VRRVWLSRAAIAFGIAMLIHRFLFEATKSRWAMLAGHDQELQHWVLWGYVLSGITFALAFFCFSWRRVGILVVSAASIAFWYHQSLAY